MRATSGLARYRRKRDFERTREPRGRKKARKGFSYVIQKHAARRLHYDFRLELDGVLLSWAVPKGPSLDPQVKRLAVQTEDHPVEYGGFEGTIPRGEYGGGTVLIWDRGSWEPEGDPRAAYAKGHLAFVLHGERLHGRWHLVRTRGRGEKTPTWLLFKGTDDRASKTEPIVDRETSSVATHRSLEEIASGRRPMKLPALAADDGARRAKAPAHIEVEKATLTTEVPDGDDWLHELKLDGYRVIAHLRRGQPVGLSTRNGNDFAARAPAVARELAQLDVDEAILDGEMVVLRPDGVSDFQLLQNALGGASPKDVLYYAFDLLHLDGLDLRGAPLEARKRQLADVLGRTPRSRVRLSDHIVGDGPAFFEQACAAGAEGIIAKRRDSTYRGTRTRDWRKIKCLARQEFVIGGFTEPSGSRSLLGALLIGFWEDGELRYAGKVGTGFTEASLRELHAKLAPLERDTPPFTDALRGAERRGVHWVQPKLVAEVEYTELTSDRRLRHPTFRGLREDKSAKTIGLERPTPGAEPSAARAGGGRRATATRRTSEGKPVRVSEKPAAKERTGGRAAASRSAMPEPVSLPKGVRFTHPERVLYPEAGITKRDLALYYAAVAPWMMPHVARRPLSIVRCPQGHTKACFFQKHAQKGQPEAIRIVPIEDEGGLADYTYIRDVEGLLSLVQMSVLEIHTWGSHVRNHERPDLIVLDLDPHEDVPWGQVVDTASLLRELFEQIGLESFVKTTGGKGLHVCVPFQSRLGWEEVKSFTQVIAEALVRDAPDRYVATMSKAKRKGKIFVDYLRNGRGATFIAPYSTRARPGAPVALPVEWEELADLRPGSFTVKTVLEHIRTRKRDPWARMREVKQTLTRRGIPSAAGAPASEETRFSRAATKKAAPRKRAAARPATTPDSPRRRPPQKRSTVRRRRGRG